MPSIAATAASISGVFGLLGFIAYAILKVVTADSAARNLTPELVAALKDHGINPELAKAMDKEALRDYLVQQGIVSEKLIADVLAPEVGGKRLAVLWVSTGLILLAALLGGLHYWSERSIPAPTTHPDVEIKRSEDRQLGPTSQYRRGTPQRLSAMLAAFVPALLNDQPSHQDTTLVSAGQAVAYILTCGTGTVPYFAFLTAEGVYRDNSFNTSVYLRALSEVSIGAPEETKRIRHYITGVEVDGSRLRFTAELFFCDRPSTIELSLGPLRAKLDISKASWEDYPYKTGGKTLIFHGVHRAVSLLFRKPDWVSAYARSLSTAQDVANRDRQHVVELIVLNSSDQPVSLTAVDLIAHLPKTVACMGGGTSEWQNVVLSLERSTARGRSEPDLHGWTILGHTRMEVRASFRPEACQNVSELKVQVPTETDIPPHSARRLVLKLQLSALLPSSYGSDGNGIGIGLFIKEACSVAISVAATSPVYPRTVSVERQLRDGADKLRPRDMRICN